MSAAPGRGAPALYDLALRLAHEAPDGLPPEGGFRLDRARPPRPLPVNELRRIVAEVFAPGPEAGGPGSRLERLAAARPAQLATAVRELPLPPGPVGPTPAMARRLAREGTDPIAVTVGIALLGRFGDAADVPCLSALGLLRDLNGPAVQALRGLDRRAAAFAVLAVRPRAAPLRPLLLALRSGERAAVRRELVSMPVSPRELSVASEIIGATGLPALLAAHPDDPELLYRAALLLHAAAEPRGPVRPDDVPAPRELYERVAAGAAVLPPTLDHAALLLSVAQDLSSGTGALPDWPPGRRAVLLDRLDRVSAAMGRAVLAGAGGEEQERRARWIGRVGRRPFRLPDGPDGFRIEVVHGDPAERGRVETRVLFDGRPVVPELFGFGPAEDPAVLLDEGLLRASAEPREVRLATASCAEECCGALYVTVRRDGDRVVWERWRRSCYRPGLLDVPARSFDARAYDAELARAEADDSADWRARTVARLLNRALRARPELLHRWDADLGRVGTCPDEPDTVDLTFWYVPGRHSGTPDRPDRPLAFRWLLPEDGFPPEAQAAAALHRLATERPTSWARICAGSRERAEELGFTWPWPE
ncbi:hypothetical protein ACIQBJ_04385 [Kitasatospora sp. NPDC088391]|uniref:hypothetical protein n=1 Tax=Kitasatospora sp. NPDC088391 TaxID=3364074 RepID=UPI00381B8A95